VAQLLNSPASSVTD